jgi:hypothetical protein
MVSKIAALVRYLIERRRLNWIEVSVSRAWSHDIPPRLFDVSNL